MAKKISRRGFGLASVALLTGSLASSASAARMNSGLVVPGTGARVAKTGDDFEDESWVYTPQLPKSSWNIDKEIRVPGGVSQNRLWVEAAKRGQPDIIKRIPTPPGGIEGSTGSMLIQSLRTGVPGQLSYAEQQDDLLHNLAERIGGEIPVSSTPNCVCRVYIPAASQWERRNGSSFGFRVGLWGVTPKGKDEEYWPGLFLVMMRETTKEGTKETMRLNIRADGWGRDLYGPSFEPASWCTLGMSMTPDGQVQFFGKKGVEDLTAKDHLGSYHPYGYRATRFQTFFYNVINRDDGQSWSTPWTIDNAMLYVASAPQQRAAYFGSGTTR